MSKRQQILESFLDMVAAGGFHDASMRDLSRHSGVSIGNIYHYFPGKDELISGLYADCQEKRVLALSENMEDEPAESMIKKYWSNLFQFYTRNKQLFYFLEQYTHSPMYTEEIRDRDIMMYDPIISALEKCIAKGEVRYMHPLSMLYIIFGHAAACAKLHLTGKVTMIDYQKDVVNQSCWDSLRPMKY